MTSITRRQGLALLAAFAPSPLLAERWYLDGAGLALRGYDPTTYFTDEMAIPGSIEHELEWDDALWRFETAESRDLFRSDPESYLPEYGGYCAEGIARGFTRISDPTVWVMVNGKLYLHYTVEAQNRWADDIRGNIRTADEKWPGLRDMGY